MIWLTFYAVFALLTAVRLGIICGEESAWYPRVSPQEMALMYGLSMLGGLVWPLCWGYSAYCRVSLALRRSR